MMHEQLVPVRPSPSRFFLTGVFTLFNLLVVNVLQSDNKQLTEGPIFVFERFDLKKCVCECVCVGSPLIYNRTDVIIIVK